MRLLMTAMLFCSFSFFAYGNNANVMQWPYRTVDGLDAMSPQELLEVSGPFRGWIRHVGAMRVWRDQTSDKQLLLNAILERFLHQQGLMVLSGAAPAGSLLGFNPLMVMDILTWAREESILRRPDLKWFFVGDAEEFKRADPLGAYSADYDFIFYSANSVAKMLTDPDSMKILHRAGFNDLPTVENAVEFLKEIIPLGGKDGRFDLAYGLFMGYPKKEIMAFAAETLAGERAANRLGVNYFRRYQSLNLFGFANLTQQSDTEIRSLKTKAREAVRLLHQATARGISRVDIVNHWEQLQCGRLLLERKL